MYRPILWATITVAAVFASGEFIVLHSPDSVEFKGEQEIDQSLLKEVFSTALGFTPKKRGNWSGMYISNLFDLPEAVVGIAIEGVESLDSPRGKKFPLDVDEVEETTWQALSRRLEERDNDNTLVRICVSDGLDALGQSALGELKPTSIDETSLKSLSLNNEEDRKYIEDLKLLHAIAKKVPSAITANGKPDVYWLVVSGVRPLIDLHGKDSPAVKEALALLNDALSDISKAFMDAYSDKVVIAAFTNDASKVRHTRAINLARERREETKPLQVEDLNLAKRYSESYPVIFNILLWFGVAFFFSLLAICIAIADMDPGRDSIIYRMTSNRMKKDN